MRIILRCPRKNKECRKSMSYPIAYVLGRNPSVFAYVLGRNLPIFAYVLGKNSIFAASEVKGKAMIYRQLIE